MYGSLYGPMPEETFFIIFSIWLPQSRLSSMFTPTVSSGDLGNSKIISFKSRGNCYST